MAAVAVGQQHQGYHRDITVIKLLQGVSVLKMAAIAVDQQHQDYHKDITVIKLLQGVSVTD